MPSRLDYVALAARSALLMARMRAAGMTSGIVTCDGAQPVLYGDGSCEFGRVAFRGRTARSEIGARAGGKLWIGNGVFINQGVSIVAHEQIRVGDDTGIGDFVAIFDTDHHPVDEHAAVRTAATEIGRDVWIGRGAIVLPGVNIGDHSVIGAGAVVTRDVPALTVFAGNPARQIRTLACSPGWRRQG